MYFWDASRSYLNDIYVITWKNYHIRKYYLILTIVELVIPVIIFCIGLSYRNKFHSFNRERQEINKTYSPFDAFRRVNNPITYDIGYAPDNDFNREITSKAGEIIDSRNVNFFAIANLSHLKNWLKSDVLDHYTLKEKSEYELRTRFETKIEKRFGILFESGKDEKNFRYQILALYRDLPKNTRRLFADTFDVEKFNKGDSYLSSGFVALQYALDEAFIRLKSKLSREEMSYFNITIYKIPYEKYMVERNPENLVYHCTLIGFGFLAITIPYYVAKEKRSGMKTMMKVIGMSEMSFWFGWITYSLCSYLFVTIFIAVILKINVAEGPYYSKIDITFLWVIFFLYYVANMVFLFAIGSVISKHWVAVVCSMIACFLSSSLFQITYFTYEYDDQQHTILRYILLSLFPNLVMYNALKALQYFQMKGDDIGFMSFYLDIDDPQIYTMRTILVYFLASILINSIIIIGMGQIFPGKYGYRRHPFSFLKAVGRIIGVRKKKRGKHSSEYDSIMNHCMEPVDESEIGVQVLDLQKSFGYFHRRSVLRNINLNFLKGEITVILGHNGAGKTTLLNVISGMTSKTNGEMFQEIDGKLKHVKHLEKLGFCPQPIIYFHYLTVEEHVLFFGMARGLSKRKAVHEARGMMDIFNIQNTASCLVNELSGGMRKKLGLLIALIGRPEIIILDEPTSGMDVNIRRSTWDLLKKLKKNRTIIITTQDMEEADILGNRIAIMHDSQIFCYGSSNFLKDLFGTGYNLTLFKGRDFDMENTTNLIRGVISSASVMSNKPSKIVYNLPLSFSGSFANFFRLLENNMSSLSIAKMQMTATTMNQVFTNVAFLAGKYAEKAADIALPFREIPVELRTGISLIFHQTKALFLKKWKITSRRHHHFISSFIVAVIVGIINVEIIYLSYTISGDSKFEALNLTLRKYVRPKTFVFMDDIAHKNAIDEYKTYIRESGGMVENAGKEMINASKINLSFNIFGDQNLYEFRDNLIGAVLLSNYVKIIFYNALIPHSPPISVNIYTNALLRYFKKNTPDNDSTIETKYQPVELTNEILTLCAPPEESFDLPLFWWIFIFNSAVLAMFVLFTAFVISQRIHGIKQIQIMSNLSEWTYWLGNFIYDFSFYFIIITITLVIMHFMDTKYFFYIPHRAYFVLALLLYGISGLLYCYVFSSLFQSISMFLTINVILNITCHKLLVISEADGILFVKVLRFITAVLPPFSFLNFLVRYLRVELNHNRCLFCPDFEKALCEEEFAERHPFMDIDKSLGTSMDPPIYFIYYLFGDIFLYGILLFITNSRLGSWVRDFGIGVIFGKNVMVDPKDEKEADKYVRAEKQYIKSVFDRAQPSDHALMVYNLKKNLVKFLFGKFSPVGGLNFHVDVGSCFGIVGVNGAGKSTTFKILTGYMHPTDGDAKVHNISLRKQLRKYKSMIGSCPQMDITFEELSAKEMLHLIATLRGLRNADEHVKNWVSILNMEDYQNDQIETYSTGGRRKLGIALSMIGDPKIVFLDEPTSGVDPVARNYMHQIIKNKKLSGQSVVIASQNMMECELLCDRVAIIHNGIFKRIGSITALKKQYANGFTLVVRLRLVSEYSEKVPFIITDVLQTFEKHRCLIRDQRLGLLQFRILNENILWSEMFGEMEEIKRTYDKVIEDFRITNATIAEEAFISAFNNPIRTLSL